jgi:hypothetical protein
MGVSVIRDRQSGIAAMYCNTEDRAFGPVFTEDEDPEDFMEWLRTSDVPWAVGSHVSGDGTDPRHYPPGDLEEVVNHWRRLIEDGDL